MSELYHTHISSKQSRFSLNLQEVWKYKDLIVLYSRRSFALSYKQTVLGPIWLFLNPLITTVMHTLVFSGIAGIQTDGTPAILFHMTSTAIWSFFASCVTNNAHTFTSNRGLFGKVYFPRLTVPLANVITTIIKFGIQMIMVIGLLVFFIIRGEVNPVWWAWLLIPFVLLHLGIMGMGVGILISSLTTKYRDLSILVGFGVQLWMYATPVVYPLSQLGDSMTRTMLMINPATMPIELLRYAVLGKGTIRPLYMITSLMFALCVALLGIIVFNRTEKTFMDTV